jgi:hypothetical protein
MATGRVPGPLGFSDSAGLLINTRRPLGVAGTAAVPLSSSALEPVSASSHVTVPKTKKAVTATPPKAATKVVGASGTHSSGARSLEEFTAAVKEGQIRHLQTKKGRHQFDDVPAAELETVEGDFQMRKAAAQDCKQLLADARAALAEGKTAKDHKATLTKGIGIQSAYRSYAVDGAAWRTTFKKHYEKTETLRAGLVGGPHGDRAVSHLVGVMVGKKAPPGWSNHSNGTAVDFNTFYGRVHYTTNTDEEHRKGWRQTWLHHWLVANAAKYGFQPLATEEWHWDHQ